MTLNISTMRSLLGELAIMAMLIADTSPPAAHNTERTARIPVRGEWVGWDTETGGEYYRMKVNSNGVVTWASAGTRMPVLQWRLEVTRVYERSNSLPTKFDFVLVSLQSCVPDGTGKAEVKICGFDYVLEIALAMQDKLGDSSETDCKSERILLRPKDDLDYLYKMMTNAVQPLEGDAR